MTRTHWRKVIPAVATSGLLWWLFNEPAPPPLKVTSTAGSGVAPRQADESRVMGKHAALDVVSLTRVSKPASQRDPFAALIEAPAQEPVVNPPKRKNSTMAMAPTNPAATVTPSLDATPATPVAPPIPFKVLGMSVEGDQRTVFLEMGGRYYFAQPGTRIGTEYVVQDFDGSGVRLLYTPLNQSQVLALSQTP